MMICPADQRVFRGGKQKQFWRLDSEIRSPKNDTNLEIIFPVIPESYFLQVVIS